VSCGGGRDKWKRPVLGGVAAKYCDKIFLTNEDPYDEDDLQIVSQIESGITSDKKTVTKIVLDRRRAIRESLEIAKPNDAVIITGKGSELWMCLAKGKKIAWDERKVVLEEFKNMNPHTKRTHTSSFSARGASVRSGVGVKKYEILEHKADLKIRAFGRTKEELFSNCLFGMSESMGSEVKNREKASQEIKINSPDFTALLVDFLSEALYLSQTNKEIYFEVSFKNFSDNKLEGRLSGQKVERFGEDIKAVTYHGLDICQGKDGIWEAVILFDI
jgi:SHS2 domain-containing protein